MITCRHIRQLHHAFIDGEMSPGLNAEVHAHLLQCPQCQREVEMLRAVGDVVSHDDHAMPQLDSGFASRVVASLPKSSPMPASRQAAPRPFWRAFAPAFLPAAAAAIFLVVAFWPSHESGKPTLVAGTAVLRDVVNPTLDAVADTQKAAKNLNRLLEISVGQARSNVQEGMSHVDFLKRKPSEPLSILDVLLRPVDEMIKPVDPAAERRDAPDSVRF